VARELKDMRILELLSLWYWHLKAIYRKNEKEELVEVENAEEHRKAIAEIDIELESKLNKRFKIPDRKVYEAYHRDEDYQRI